jgi:hypothetical protein
MATLETFVPAWGEAAEWDEAYEKVENYLRAHRVQGKWQRADLTHRVLRRIASEPPPVPRPDLSALAIDELERQLDEWIARALPESAAWPKNQRLVSGRLAVLLSDVYARWPSAFLSNDPPPELLVRALQGAILTAGPGLQKGRMVPRSEEFGRMAGWMGETVGLFERKPFLSVLLVWILVILVLGYLFRLTR